jgi:hypothetical protein
MRSIRPKLKMHGITKYDSEYYFAFEIEEDRQLDFNKIAFTDFDDDSKFKYTFTQYAEVIPRKLNKDDPIKKFEYCVSVDFNYGVVLRESGMVDLYWDF